MSNYSEQIRAVIKQLPYNKIFVASELKDIYLNTIPEKTYYKVLERLKKQNVIVHLTKGLYYRPNVTEQGIVPIPESNIIEHYLSEGAGIIVGDKLLNQKGIVSEEAQQTDILSSNLHEEKKHIGSIQVQRIDFLLDDSTIPVVETMDILQNFNKAKNVNKHRFMAYMKHFANNYSDEATQYVLENRKYKKSTIAFLERMLAWHGVDNSLSKHLSPLSEYKIPTIEELRPGIPAEMQSHLKEYVSELQRIYKTYLDKVILYGSYARGDYNEESDVDIMILLNITDTEIKAYRHQLSELTYDFNMNYNMDIKPIAKSEKEFTKWSETYPFYINIKREGVELFGAA